MKKLLCALALGSVLFVTGCSKDKAEVAVEETQLEGSLISSTPKTFTIFLSFDNMVYNPEWAVWKKIAENTNINLEGVISQSNSNEEEAFNLMLSSGKLADIVGFKKSSELEKLGRDGGLIPLNDLINEHAPHIKALLESDPKFARYATSLDGNIYFIPKAFELKTAEFTWIRQDWLTKLNLEVPTNVEELYTVLTAFRNEDPNGNGLKDEIPLFDRAGWKIPAEYLFLFDTSTQFYPRDGKMGFEPLSKNFYEGSKELAKWYAEGLIDPEFFTRGPKSRDVLLSSNKGGFTHDWGSTGNYNSKLAKDIPGFEMLGIAPIKSSNGVQIERTSRNPVAGWGISSQAKDPVTLIKFFDYFFTKEGSDLINWGIEGDSYITNADGTRSFTDKVMKVEGQTPLSVLRSMGVQYRVGMKQDGNYEYAFLQAPSKKVAKLYNENRQWFAKDVPPYHDGRLDIKIPAELENEYLRIMSQVNPYVDETFQKWILGASDVDDDYESFIAELNKRGIQRATEIMQIAYDLYLGN